MTASNEAPNMPDLNAFQFETDLATLAVFDPSGLRPQVRAPKEWWRGDPTELNEFDEGKILVLPIGRDGEYRVRLAFNQLRENEQPYLRKSLDKLVLDVPGGSIFVGPGERVPGGGLGDRYPRIVGQGELFKVPAGKYSATVHVFDWRVDRKWFDDDGEPITEAPADFVILLKPFTGEADQFFADFPESIPDLLSLRARPKIEVKPPSSHVLIGARTKAIAQKSPRKARSKGAASVVVESPSIDPEYLELFAQLQELPELQETLLATSIDYDDADQFHFHPQNTQLKAYTWSAGELQRKGTRVREFIRVLEQKVNTSKIEAFEKAELQASITNVYRAIQDLFVIPAPAEEPEQAPTPINSEAGSSSTTTDAEKAD